MQEPAECCTFILWFDASFTRRFGASEEVILSTSPHEPQTHWHQALVLLRCATGPRSPGCAALQWASISMASDVTVILSAWSHEAQMHWHQAIVLCRCTASLHLKITQ